MLTTLRDMVMLIGGINMVMPIGGINDVSDLKKHDHTDRRNKC